MNNDVTKYLLHRPPFLFVDSIKEISNGKSIVALRKLHEDEWYFKGHFPGEPVFPGVLMVEALAQAACILMCHSTQTSLENCSTYLTTIEKAAYKRIIKPGETMELSVQIEKNVSRENKTFFKFKGNVSVDGQIACSADFGAVLVQN